MRYGRFSSNVEFNQQLRRTGRQNANQWRTNSLVIQQRDQRRINRNSIADYQSIVGTAIQTKVIQIQMKMAVTWSLKN
jgi:hypothetical protein